MQLYRLGSLHSVLLQDMVLVQVRRDMVAKVWIGKLLSPKKKQNRPKKWLK